MQIDWTTFILEIVNFLALVWILKRFLYRPVLDTLAKRRAGIERSQAEGRSLAAQADALKVQYEQRLAEWEKEKAAARTVLETELAGERERQMQALSRSLADERARQLAQEVHRQELARHELENQAIAQAQGFVSTLLTRLAGPALESRLLDVFLEDLRQLPEVQLAGLRSAALAAAAQARITSAGPLDAAQRQRLAEALASRLDAPIPLSFSEDTALVAGLRITVGPWQLKASLADELAFFAASANHAD